METLSLLLPSSPSTDFKSSAQSSSCSTPFTTAPSSPPYKQNSNFFFFNGATTTSAKLYAQFTHSPSLRDANFNLSNSSPPSPSLSSVPFEWEHSPGILKNRADDRDDFEFDFTEQLDRDSLCADELFDGGKIRPFKPPPRMHITNNDSESEQSDSCRFRTANSSPRLSSSGNIFHSPRQTQHVIIDPFTKALEEARKARASDFNPRNIEQSRGRGTTATTKTATSHNKTRSLSPLRVADIISEHHPNNEPQSFWSRAYRKWKIKDLLFRSASEGRATEKLAGKEYSESRRFMESSISKASFRLVETTKSDVSVSVGSTSKRSGNRVVVSAHELHYKLNRAVSQEMRKKTFLPYNQGLLGCLGFVPGGGGGSEVSRSSTGSMTRGR